MSDLQPAPDNSSKANPRTPATPAGSPNAPPRFSIRNVLVLALPPLAIAGGVLGYVHYVAQPARNVFGPQLKRFVVSVTQLDPDWAPVRHIDEQITRLLGR